MRRLPVAVFVEEEHHVVFVLTVKEFLIGYDDKRGETSVDIPLIDYALMVKSAHYADISDQEFLDRQDKYDMVFFLDGRRGGCCPSPSSRCSR